MIDYDKIIDEIKFELKKLDPKNLKQFFELNHTYNLNQHTVFSWVNPKCKRTLLSNCKKLTIDISENRIIDFLKGRGIKPFDLAICQFTNKFWEQVLTKHSKKIIAIQGSLIIVKENFKLSILPFSIVQTDEIDFFYTPAHKKWVFINGGVRTYKGLTKRDIERADPEITKYNLNKIILGE